MNLDENAYAVYKVLEGYAGEPLDQSRRKLSIESLTNFPIISGTNTKVVS